MALPEILIDLHKIKQNVQAVLSLAKPYGTEVVGVTKSFLGEPEIAGAMLAGGINMLADARLANVKKLRQAFPQITLMLLRLPALSQAAETIACADISLNSEFRILQALSREAIKQGKQHRVILMVDLGDLREGILPDDLFALVEKTLKLDGLILEGIGTNFACYGGVIPTTENLSELAGLAEKVEQACGYRFAVISGGNSANLPLLFNGELALRINQLRIGEGIVLGRETVTRRVLPGAVPDAFVLRAEVLECQVKPTQPKGLIGQDAFGQTHQFCDEGLRRRGILAVGRQDVPPEGLILRDSRLKIFGASSDHLILDLTEAPELGVGSVVEFDLRYSGLLGAMTSPYVKKRVKLA